MLEFADIVEFYCHLIDALKNRVVTIQSPLESMVFAASNENLSYVDNRKEASEKYGFDLWRGIDLNSLKAQGINEKLLYSASAQFPDFVFQTRSTGNVFFSGSLLELKDAASGSISSFNSTLPTKTKSLEEVDILNGRDLVSRIASIKDSGLSSEKNYRTYQRRCFYLIRTHKNSDKVKLSLIDASFFETLPKESLIYQMFLNILQKHQTKKEVQIPEETLVQFEKIFPLITDQTIIACSQDIQKASIKPRLRIMAEVHPEGNPHSTHYPEITAHSVNLIIHIPLCTKELEEKLKKEVPDINEITIQHKRNGKHVVFQFIAK